MFHRLAASLNIAFKWFCMFDLDQTFSLNILRCEQMFDRLATSANKACASGKKQPIRNRSWVTSTFCKNKDGGEGDGGQHLRVNRARVNLKGLKPKQKT